MVLLRPILDAIKLLLIFVTSARGLRCMTCEGAASHEECDSKGILKQCLLNEERCAIEERKVEYGPRRLIFKSCKQPHACNNNFIQNNRSAWWPSQCNPDHPNSVCRCCCHTDSCNVGPHKCMAPLHCGDQHIAPSNGQVMCTSNNTIGSICTFTCNVGYHLMGEETSLCQSQAVWSSPSPLCSPVRCNPPFRSPDNGQMTCSERNNPGSACRFQCDRGFILVGSANSRCSHTQNITTAWWSRNAPVCKPISCPDQGEIRNGDIVCSQHNVFESHCQFECKNEQYNTHPPDVTSNMCLANGSWSIPKPCCIKPCPPHAAFDLVMVLDSSSSVGIESWKITLEFVKSFANLYDLNVLNFALFRYNSEVDSVNEIRFDSGFEPPLLLEAIGKIPYDGTGTNTGKALTYAGEVMLSMSSGRRRGAQAVIIVVTDGKSLDDVSIPARNLRRDGIKTFAVGVVPLDSNLDRGELETIAGHAERVVIAEEGYLDLNEDFARQLSKDVCGDPCLQPDLEDL